jgi:hypothetical protein
VQVDPIKPVLKAPVTKRLKLKQGELLSRCAFKFDLRRYNKVSTLILGISQSLQELPSDAQKHPRQGLADTARHVINTHLKPLLLESRGIGIL